METINGARVFVREGEEELIGFDHALFSSVVSESFNCGICQYVVRDPRECEDCGHLFCSNCLLNWLKINR